MTTLTTSLVDPILFHLPEIWYVMAFSVLFVVVFILGLAIRGVLVGGIFCLVLTIVAYAFIPFLEAVLGMSLSFMAMVSYFIRKTPEEKPDEKSTGVSTLQSADPDGSKTNTKTAEIIHDTFDKVQFNKGEKK